MHPEFFGDTVFSRGFLGSCDAPNGVVVTPPMGPRQSPGGGPGGKATRSSWDLVI